MICSIVFLYVLEVEKKMCEEIERECPNEVDVKYEDLKNFTYLLWVIKEVLRLYPPV